MKIKHKNLLTAKAAKMKDCHIISYFYFPGAVFDEAKNCFQRWANWQFRGEQSGKDSADKASKYHLLEKLTLKLFVHPAYEESRLQVVCQIVEKLGFEMVARTTNKHGKQLTFQYVKDVNEMCMMEAKMQWPTVVPNRYENAGYFTRLDGQGVEWKFPCREFKHVLYWLRYYNKYHPEERMTVHRTSYRFQENEISPGGKWIDEEDGSDMGGFFYGPPEEKIQYSPAFLAMSKHMEVLNVNAEFQMEMVRWYSLDDKEYTGRMWVSLPTSILAIGEVLEKLCLEHVIKRRRYQGEEFRGKVVLESRDVREEMIVHYRYG